ncbi:hypothetical protein F511_24156 [Dorcoceras hygrometricum]|uniref:Uncharacterized protein n=1 Tax=Dorcoceras hygrometricum TaxID=472368 RepID=A0A2Z7BCT7_9LAMI|nr:hypothetical protein F511_24156 [Dorcoceras hygrometricum]
MVKLIETSPQDPLDSIGYTRTRASGESSTTKHRLHMLRDLTQSRHLMILTESAPGSDQFHEETGTSNARTDSPHRGDRNKSDHEKNRAMAAAAGGRRRWAVGGGVRHVGEGIQLAVGPQPLWLRNHNFGFAQRIMVKRLATSRHDPLSITDSACKNQLVVVSIQYGPFNTYIPIRSTTIGKSRVARDPIAMHTSWRLNSDITSVTRQTHLPKTHPVLWPEIYTLLSPQIA